MKSTNLLKELREKNNYDQKAIAKKLKVSIRTYNKIENNLLSVNLDKVFDILKAIDLSDAEISNFFNVLKQDYLSCEDRKKGKEMKIIKNSIFVMMGTAISIAIIAYAGSYNSSEINYNKNGTNIKVNAALDELYGNIGKCPEGMNCLTDDDIKYLGWTTASGKWQTTITSVGYTAPGTTGGHPDRCGNSGVNCACWYINQYETGYIDSGHHGEKFSYNGHTGCSFVSKNCKFPTSNNGGSYECSSLEWNSVYGWSMHLAGASTCSGTIACET